MSASIEYSPPRSHNLCICHCYDFWTKARSAAVKADYPLPPGQFDASIASAPFDPLGQAALNLSRDYVLTNSTPPTWMVDRVTHSTARSVYRVHRNTIAPWNDFGAPVIQYWNIVPQVDKLVEQGVYRHCFQRAGFSRARNKGNVKALIYEFIEMAPPTAAMVATSLDLQIDIQFCSSGSKDLRSVRSLAIQI